MAPKGYQGEFDDMSCDELKTAIKESQEANSGQKGQLAKVEKAVAKKRKRSFFTTITDFISLNTFKYNEGWGNDIYEDSYENTILLDPKEYGGIKEMRVVSIIGGIHPFAHRIHFDWESPGWDRTFKFTDNTGDVYKIWCFRNGRHWLDYNSKDPRLVRVSW